MLPERVTGLTASRVGNEVRLQWTTPTRTTDKLLIAGPVVAEICRETAVVATASTRVGQNAVKAPCSPVIMRKEVKPGPSEVTDTLLAELTSAPARLLVYHVQLRNAAGRTAGPSVAVYAASGPAPPAVEELYGRPTKAGVVLEWKATAGGTEAVELDRSIVQSPTESSATTSATPSTTTATTAGSSAEHKGKFPGATKEPLELRLRVGGAVDVGGTVDRTAQIGHAYRYTVQRIRSVELGGQRIEVHSAVSTVVTVDMKDMFPPEAPIGLVAVPGFASAANNSTQKPTIDLSWEPDMEPRVAGYKVYRHDLDGNATNEWHQLNSELLPGAAYRDLAVVARRRYDYRVTAVSDLGNESAPSEEVVETAPEQ
jgi:hypothetical protein